MPSYSDRAKLIKQLSDQAYFDALKRDDAQKKDVRVGGIDGRTGRYQVLTADGGLVNSGVPLAKGAPPTGDFVRGFQSPNSNAIGLGYRAYVPSEFVARGEEEETALNSIKTILLRDSKIWIGGDRSEPEEILDPANLPIGLSLNLDFGFKLSNIGSGLDDWFAIFTATKQIESTYFAIPIIVTPEGVEVSSIEFNDLNIFNTFDGYISLLGAGAEERMDIASDYISTGGLPFPLRVSTRYYDYIANNSSVDSFVDFEGIDATNIINVNESFSYTSTSYTDEGLRTICTAVRDPDDNTLTGALRVSRDADLIVYERGALVYFGVEEGGTLPSPLAANTPYLVVFAGAPESDVRIILVAPFSAVNIPTEEGQIEASIRVTTAGSNFYIYKQRRGTTNRVALIARGRESYLIEETEIDPNYDPSENTSFLRTKGFKLFLTESETSIFYDLSASQELLQVRNTSLIGNVITSGNNPVINDTDDESNFLIDLFTLNDDGTITKDSTEAIFIRPSDRNVENYQILATSFYVNF